MRPSKGLKLRVHENYCFSILKIKLFCIILKSHPNNMQPEKHVFLAISLPSHPGQENPRNFVPMSGMDKAKGIRSPICIIPFLSLLMVH